MWQKNLVKNAHAHINAHLFVNVDDYRTRILPKSQLGSHAMTGFISLSTGEKAEKRPLSRDIGHFQT